jgi:hypothetical protein
VPHRCAHPTSLCSRSGWSPAATSRIAAVSGPTPTRRAGRERARQRGGSRARRGGRSDLEASRLAGPAGATQNAWFSQRRRLAGDAIPRFRPTNAVVEWPAKRARTSSGPGLPPSARIRLWLCARQRALGLAASNVRIASTAPSWPFVLRGSAGLGGPGCADGIGHIGLALPASGLPVAPGRPRLPARRRLTGGGSGRLRRAGTFDSDAVDGPESA